MPSSQMTSAHHAHHRHMRGVFDAIDDDDHTKIKIVIKIAMKNKNRKRHYRPQKHALHTHLAHHHVQSTPTLVLEEFGLRTPAPITSRAFRAIHMGVSMTQDVLLYCATTSFHLVTV